MLLCDMGKPKYNPPHTPKFPQKLSYLVTKSMTTDDNGLGPARNETGNHLAEDGLAKHRAAKDVTDGAIRAQPHLLQIELC